MGPLLAILFVLVRASAASDRFADLPSQSIPPDLLETMAQVEHWTLPDRMVALSELMLGQPYRLDPTGEGWGVDSDPQGRYDAYDCVTFVEEVLALAWAFEPTEVPHLRAALRWRNGEPTYENRRHFMMTEWIPENIAAGRLRDITAEIGDAVRIEKDLTMDTWQGWGRRRLFSSLPDERLPVGRFTLDVLTIDEALRHAETIPVGTIVVTVREPRAGIPIVVTHMGFVVPKGADGRARVRHATKLGSPGVRDHGLAWYIEHIRSYTGWPGYGIALLAPVERGPRAVNPLP